MAMAKQRSSVPDRLPITEHVTPCRNARNVAADVRKHFMTDSFFLDDLDHFRAELAEHQSLAVETNGQRIHPALQSPEEGNHLGERCLVWRGISSSPTASIPCASLTRKTSVSRSTLSKHLPKCDNESNSPTSQNVVQKF
jgi:hypothetical protein